MCAFSTTNMLLSPFYEVKLYIVVFTKSAHSLLSTRQCLVCEVCKRFLIAKRCALMLVLIGFTVGFNIARYCKRYAIFYPRLTEHLFCNHFFRVFAFIVFVICTLTIEKFNAANNLSAHIHKRHFFAVRGFETNGKTSATRSLILFAHGHKHFSRNIFESERVKVTRKAKRKNVVMRVSFCRVGFALFSVDCRVFHVVLTFGLSLTGTIISPNCEEKFSQNDTLTRGFVFDIFENIVSAGQTQVNFGLSSQFCLMVSM